MRPICLMLLLIPLAGCRSPLETYVHQHRYTSFTIPRATHGPGTIIDFKDGYESIVASPEPPYAMCTTGLVVSTFEVALPKTSYTLKRDNSLEFNLGKILGEHVDVSGALR